MGSETSGPRIEERTPSFALRGVTLVAMGVIAAFSTPAAAQTRSDEAPIFRLVTFQTFGELRLVSEADVMDYVFGYTVHNDVSGRTLRTGATSSEGSSMTKGMDTFAPLGPYVTLEDVPDPHDLAMETKLNGNVVEMSNAHTSYMRHKIPATLSLLSRILTLEPGDIVATRVPMPTAQLEAGDTVETTRPAEREV